MSEGSAQPLMLFPQSIALAFLNVLGTVSMLAFHPLYSCLQASKKRWGSKTHQSGSNDFATCSGMRTADLRFRAAPQPRVSDDVIHSSASSISAVSTSSDNPLSGPKAALAMRLTLCRYAVPHMCTSACVSADLTAPC